MKCLSFFINSILPGVYAEENEVENAEHEKQITYISTLRLSNQKNITQLRTRYTQYKMQHAAQRTSHAHSIDFRGPISGSMSFFKPLESISSTTARKASVSKEYHPSRSSTDSYYGGFYELDSGRRKGSTSSVHISRTESTISSTSDRESELPSTPSTLTSE